jgi:hypothetical protein
MTKDLQTLADEVTDEASFLEFVTALGSDWDDEQAKEAQSPKARHSALAQMVGRTEQSVLSLMVLLLGEKHCKRTAVL